MRIVLSTLLLSIVPLMADFYPPTVKSSVSGINQKNIVLKQGFPAKGMSAVVMHRYGKDLRAITSYMRYDGSKQGTLINNEPIDHGDLPTVKPKVRVGDQVIGGYLYKNILLLAPDANTYAKIIKSADKNWIHPDIFAMFLAKEGDQIPTQENLQKFANEYQVGLIYIVQRGKGVLYDPISKRYVSQKALTGLPAKGQFPFYMRLGKIDSGWFSREKKGEYYSSIGNLK
ncbi:hypothetical protein MNB_SV-6-324 [hydrothermal vent metagenome]|uniref:Plasminogen-binding protein PgbA N-terminal domain-containing protein n=1 Tax=hydrothermal vent metagenome TaxID=652676 RepID=A0A1W1CG99_9ZZZZ